MKARPKRIEDQKGQATTEYALVLFALLAVAMGIAALWRYAETGGFVGIAAAESSHSLSVGGMQDVSLY